MFRLRTVAPLFLLSSIATPAFGEGATSHCLLNVNSPLCETERAREFAAVRNAEINASIAAVNAARAWLTLSRTHCKSPDSTTPRCQAEQAREFAAARNAEINASIGAVKAAREFEQARNAEVNTAIAAVKAARARVFAAARNAEIDASIAAVKAERARAFAAARNAEINASIAAVEAARERTLAAAQDPDTRAWFAALNAQYEEAAFATARNAEIDRSIATVKAVRAFEQARNAEIDRSIAAVKADRARAFAEARNAEINASVAAVNAERIRTFAAARNVEINASIAAVQAQRALRLAIDSARASRVETGAISLPDTLTLTKAAPVVRRTRHSGACREAARLMGPLEFSNGNAEIEQAMKPELDRVAMMARACPAIRIEIHGHSDNSAPAQISRHLAQRRAQAAVEFLVNSGVDRSRLAAIGHSDAQPLVPNTDEDNRAVNRRIEVVIDDPAMQAAAQRVMWDLAELLDPTYVPPLARLSP